jgi:hypothetical protein
MIEHHVEAEAGVFITKSAGRKGIDGKKLEADFPEVYAAVKTVGAPVVSIKVARTSGK